MHWQTLVTGLPTALSATLYVAVHGAFVGALRRKTPRCPSEVPTVTILKPVAGVDDDLEENLASFAFLDFPHVELLIGAARESDSAVPAVRRFLAAHPALRARLVITGEATGAVFNPKVAQLIRLAREASGEVLVVSDANIRVAPGYLSSLVGTLDAQGGGLVTSLIAGRGERTFGAALENAQLSSLVAPVVAASAVLSSRPVAVGKSMAMRRAELRRLGGFERVGGVLAEDETLAARFAEAGLPVGLSFEPIDNHNVTASVRKTFERHARWAKMRRTIVPWAYAFEPLISPLVVAGLVLAAAPSELAARLFAFALLLQFAGALLAATCLRGATRGALRLAALEPLRVLLHMTAWCAGWSRSVRWRGHAFVLGDASVLLPGSVERPRAPEPELPAS